MREINLKVGAVSRILIESGLISSPALETIKPSTRLSVVTDSNVAALYLDKVSAGFKSRGFDVHSHILPPGEKTKSFDNLLELYKEFHDRKLDRSSLVVALGGGVIGDLAGFAAATYMRGTRFIQIPTTLLAQVDASIGGKTAINHLGMKNYIGTFYQPETVLADPETLTTLPESELRNGFAEVVKAAVIGDTALFDILENCSELPAVAPAELLEEIIFRAAAVKVKVVEQDEREAGLRRVLNFGHTIGHALEEIKAFEDYSHGQGVAVGMVLETRLAVRLNLAQQTLADRIESLLKRIGFDTGIHDVAVESALQLMSMDKKTEAQRLVFALPRELGVVDVAEDVDPSIVRRILEEAAD
jgi:3-dehydroquinate synthase